MKTQRRVEHFQLELLALSVQFICVDVFSPLPANVILHPRPSFLTLTRAHTHRHTQGMDLQV